MFKRCRRTKAIVVCSMMVSSGFTSVSGRAIGDDARGFVTSGDELARIGERARSGAQPERWLAEKIVSDAGERWPHGNVATRFGTLTTEDNGKRCVQLDNPKSERILATSAYLINAKALAYNMTRNGRYAKEARNLLMKFARSSGFDEIDGVANYTGANQCALDISLFLPLVIDSAILLEGYPGWHSYHTKKLQSWLADVPYKTTSAIARTRKNNWGTAAAFASWSIAHYLIGSGHKLAEVYPEARSLEPKAARSSHLQSQIKMMSTSWKGDSRCRQFGIQDHGGIPDELRRGSTGCDGRYLVEKDGAYGYHGVSVGHLVYHAEAVRRHMDDELFTFGPVNGVPAIHRAIRFVIDNAEGRSHDWKSGALGILRVASRAYPDKAICQQLAKGNPSYHRDGLYLPYTKLIQPEVTCRG